MASIISTTTQIPQLVTLIDEAQSVPTNITYVGKAKLGTATATAGWQIFRIERSSTITAIQFANGSTRYNQVWDNRSSLTYTN